MFFQNFSDGLGVEFHETEQPGEMRADVSVLLYEVAGGGRPMSKKEEEGRVRGV